VRSSLRACVLLLALSAPSAGCSKSPPLVTRNAGDPRSLVVRNVRVFDAPGAALLDGARDVIVRNGRIVAIGPTGIAADDLRAVDGQGGTLLPGLVDLHTHTGSTAEPIGHFALPDVDANLAAYLYAGVTTALDLGGLSPDVFGVRAAIASGKQLGPHLYAAGPIFTAVGGHPVEVLEPNLPWLLRWYVIPKAARQIASPEMAGDEVRALLPQRPDVLKLVVDAGVGDVPRLTPESFAALTKIGHSVGIRSVTHVTSSADAVLAIENGTDALAHMPSLDEVSDALAARIAAAHVPVIATLAIWDLIGDPPRADADLLPIEREVGDPALAQRWRESNGPPSAFEQAAFKGRDGRRRSFAALRRAHVTILAGSDACNPRDLPGAGLHLELTKLVEAGMTPAEALRAATSDNARFLVGPEADFGAIEVGKRADLLLVRGDPTTQIRDLGQILAVILDGALLERRPPR
jgi:imidazolonepropionase-like amidohydrolase